MRCLALAQAWSQEGGKAVFLLQDGIHHSIEEKILAERFAVRYIPAGTDMEEDVLITSRLMDETGCEWTIIDGYQFDAAFQKRLHDADHRILALDDYGHVQHQYADLILNQNITADPGLYREREPYTRLLLGTKFALLRREFWEWRSWQREIPDRARTLLITLGGSDSNNVTEKVIHAAGQVEDDLEIKVILGANQSRRVEEISRQAGSAKHIQFVSAPSDMAELMAGADIVISAGGSTCWELAFMGVPAMIISTAENQRGIAPALERAGAALDLGWADSLQTSFLAGQLHDLIVSASTRAHMSDKGRSLVDSRGGERVIEAIHGRRFLYLRDATLDDSWMIWNWANDPVTRSASFSTGLIPWEAHAAWFLRKMADPRHLILIALADSMEPVGQIRFEIEDQQATVSINLSPEHRGIGYGSRILTLGIERLFGAGRVHSIHAYIKSDNNASKKVFKKAGFVYQDTRIIESDTAEHYLIKAIPGIGSPIAAYSPGNRREA
jgi:UDP-2,4-diacetamido-2,4,6-trideoxy-beta-L-altropyranose hydrolase